MKTKKNTKKPVRKQNHRIFKVFGVVSLTIAALVLASIIGPSSRNGRVRADNPYSQLDVAAQTYTTRTLATNPYVVDPGTVPGTVSLARYIPPAEGEHGYRGSVDPCLSHYALDNSRNSGDVIGNNPTVPCTLTSVPDSALGDQDGSSGLAALDHRWIQGEDSQAVVYQLPSPSNNAIVFPSIDHAVGIYEAVEFTVWGLPAGTPLTAFSSSAPAPWVEGRLVRVFKDGWSPHAAGTPYCQTAFTGEQHETDDDASVWSFRNANGVLVNVSFVAILADQSVHITPEPTPDQTQDNTNCFAENINGSVGSGYYTSADCEVDAVGISTGVTGCIGDECLPPPPPSMNFCSYTQGKFNDKAKNPVATYVQNNFSNLFPSGLTIGIDDGNGPRHHTTWTNVNNLRVYIGGGGTAGALSMDASNPTAQSQTGGVLASQVLALTLNIRLSGSGGGQPAGFGNLILCNTGNANLNGKTVQDILNQANLFLGGSPSYNLGLNAGALSSLIDNLNRSWDDCVQSGFAQSYLCQPQQP